MRPHAQSPSAQHHGGAISRAHMRKYACRCYIYIYIYMYIYIYAACKTSQSPNVVEIRSTHSGKSHSDARASERSEAPLRCTPQAEPNTCQCWQDLYSEPSGPEGWAQRLEAPGTWQTWESLEYLRSILRIMEGFESC